jgi:serine/threonine-protein kinase
MSQDRWARIEALFHGAIEQPVGERRTWLEAQVGADPELLGDVLRLLDSSEEPTSALDSVIGRAAADLNLAALSPGQRLGSYRVVRRIGRGGMGEVYLAERDDQEYSHRVALKVIKGFAGPEAMDCFRRERQILAELQHPHIARLLDGGTTSDGQPYLVMDHVEGVPLKRWIEEQRPALRERLRLFISVCEAIFYAHQHLIIHRDIKPGNVLVTEEGEPVLVDFGIAKILDDAEPVGAAGNLGEDEIIRASGQDHTLAPGYTPGYASPEQQAGGVVTTASDLYSLGRLLHTLIEHAPVSSRAVAPDEIQAVIDRATRTDPSQRYATAAELRRELIRFLEHRPVAAVNGGLGYRARKFAQRHRPAVLASSLMGLMLVPVLWVWTIDRQRAEAAEARMLIEARHGEQVLEFLLDTIAAAEPARARGREVSVREIVDQGRARVLADPSLDAELRARLSLALGEVFLRLEDHDPTLELLNRAAGSSVSATAARANSLLGFWLTLKEDLDAARPYLDRAQALVEADPGLPDAVVHEVRNHHSLWLLNHGEADAAAAEFQALVEVHRAAGNQKSLGRMLHNAGLAHRHLGEIALAIESFQESLAVKRESGDARTPSYANTLSALAQALVMQGDYAAAGDALEESMALRVDLFGPDHPGLHHDANEYGSMLHDRGLFDLAIEQYLRAIDLHASAGGPAIESASYINNLASALEDRGELVAAEPLFRHSLALRLEAHGEEHASVARARHNLARLLIKRGELIEAERLIEQSIEGWVAVRGPDDAATWYSRSLIGQLALERGQIDSAVERLQSALQELRVQRSDTNWWVLTTRGLHARALIEAGRLRDAEAQLQALIDDYRQSLGSDHPLAAVWALELARVELLQGKSADATARLHGIQPVIEVRMAPDSLSRSQLVCLMQGLVEPDCWRSPKHGCSEAP